MNEQMQSRLSSTTLDNLHLCHQVDFGTGANSCTLCPGSWESAPSPGSRDSDPHIELWDLPIVGWRYTKLKLIAEFIIMPGRITLIDAKSSTKQRQRE